MNAFINDLNQRLNAKLLEISKQEKSAIQKAHTSVQCVSQTLIQLRAFVLQYTFRDELEEIDFFKTIKPGIFSKYIYYTKIYHIESRRPTGGRHIHKAYLKAELENLELFRKRHPEFHQYYRTEATYSDNTYFLRSKEIPSICDDDITSGMDPQFSTGYDYLISKIIAYDHLSAWLHSKLDALGILLQPTQSEIPYSLKWTDSKASLVELIYAICATGTINNGNCEIKQLASTFEHIFQVRIPNIYQIHGELKYRENPTRYIDQLKDSFLKVLEEE